MDVGGGSKTASLSSALSTSDRTSSIGSLVSSKAGIIEDRDHPLVQEIQTEVDQVLAKTAADEVAVLNSLPTSNRIHQFTFASPNLLSINLIKFHYHLLRKSRAFVEVLTYFQPHSNMFFCCCFKICVCVFFFHI